MSKKPAYSVGNVVVSVVLITTLLWLTVSAPFIYEVQQELAQIECDNSPADRAPLENEESNPFSNSEEKVPSSNFSEEYLHDIEEHKNVSCIQLKYDNRHADGEYVAFHGEMLCPPPNSSLS